MSEQLAILLTDEALHLLADQVATLLADRQTPADTTPVAYTIPTLAAEIGVSAKTVRGAIHRGELAAVRRGTRYVISADAARAWATPSPSSRPRRGGRPPARAGRGPLAAALNATAPPITNPLGRTLT